ncbi:nidogen-like domain-containing protein [Sulfitobacter geojensis]|uniref:nidogen-like domain-containing protein n=1 Tax=Sulfitobacter geojensis TaxID=1342299 RepID=UPI0004691EF6|nr:nidogen-like domain-containing protein [Sulfitobacter geojensis]KHA52966.1 Type 1 secretion protein with C-terminal target domain [Sulfitobacter geojensis]NYI28380.1 Ca2+-binding RTX toxin-like protein [Sulfitobacter geojensis]OAN96718.1 hypothetical protein A8B74_12355 [Sulfitobacter geojensis]
MVNVTSNALLPFGAESLFRNDDRSSAAIDITSIFQSGITIGDTNYTSLYVNTNGNVTFGGGLSTFTPTGIGVGTGNLDIIAPFWADVDTRGTDDANKNVFWDFNAERDSFVVTWNDVGYYNSNQDKENTFQLELADTGNGNVQIVFRYEDVQWTTGDASGGSSGLGGTIARAGFAFGQDLSFELPSSGNQNAILELENNPGNSGVDGAWIFDIRDGALVNVGGAGNDILVGAEESDSIFGNDGDDDIDSAGGNDFVYGGNGNDDLVGGVGNDFISGGLGSDRLDGGEGFDIADCLAYEFDAGSFTINDDGTVSLTGEGGDIDTLISIEAVAFSDGDLRFDVGALESFGAAYRFYTSILNREPDGAGLDFYVSLLDDGVSLFDIAQDISTSQEFVESFGSDLDTETFLGRVYQNILNRTPDGAGLEFWRNAIDTDEVSRAEAVVYISEDDESRGITIDVIGNGYFVEDFGF